MKKPRPERKPKHEIKKQAELTSNSFAGREAGGGTRSATKRNKRSL